MTYTEYKRDLLGSIDTVRREDSNGFSYDAFKEIPEELQLTEKDLGNRVWIASYPRTTKCFLHNISEDGFQVKFKGEVPLRWFYHDEVMIHHKLWSKERIGFEIVLESKFAVT